MEQLISSEHGKNAWHLIMLHLWYAAGFYENASLPTEHPMEVSSENLGLALYAAILASHVDLLTWLFSMIPSSLGDYPSVYFQETPLVFALEKLLRGYKTQAFAQVEATRKVLTYILEWNPSLASKSSKDGHFPLAIATRLGCPASFAQELFETFPAAAREFDIETHLWLFQLAAVNMNDLETVYRFLRAYPDCLSN